MVFMAEFSDVKDLGPVGKIGIPTRNGFRKFDVIVTSFDEVDGGHVPIELLGHGEQISIPDGVFNFRHIHGSLETFMNNDNLEIDIFVDAIP